jgi:hypothetical protein
MAQQKRLNDINNILKNYSEPDIPTIIVKKIQKKFPEVKYYSLITAEQLYIGENLSLVTLDMSKLLVPGKCVKIFYRKNNSVNRIMLFNSYLNIYWKVNPKKYYIFKIISDKEIYMKEMLKDYKKILLKKK